MEMMQQEFIEVLAWVCMAFICGVFLREFAPDAFGKWLGRSGVLVALLVMCFFSEYAIDRCQEFHSLSETRANEISTGETMIARRR